MLTMTAGFYNQIMAYELYDPVTGELVDVGDSPGQDSAVAEPEAEKEA